MTREYTRAVLMAVLAAVLYGISAPTAKVLLEGVPPSFLAALLYLGAGAGMGLVKLAGVRRSRSVVEASLSRNDLPYVVAMILLDIAAPILLMSGLTSTDSSTVALLNNFEIVATALIALAVFKEHIGPRMWTAIVLIQLAVIVLSVQDLSSWQFSHGALLVLGATLCWGLENNVTRSLSIKDPTQVVVLKGFGSGIGALLVAYAAGRLRANVMYIALSLLLGFVAYGLSIYFYVRAQRTLGGARTSAYYAVSPFVGVLASWIFLRDPITPRFLVALLVMALGSYFAITEKHSHVHVHEPVIHNHRHTHDDGHHLHTHIPPVKGEHAHEHAHELLVHEHEHLPDLHHRHRHK
ncbi:DMT family transporter [Coprothermobacteraceae bacterium]|nr:DMT family transporter [Coprothermobacteraceae bacterium]